MCLWYNKVDLRKSMLFLGDESTDRDFFEKFPDCLIFCEKSLDKSVAWGYFVICLPDC